MNYVFQFMIIAIISFIGEIMYELIPLPVPASVYGLIVMFLCLVVGIIKLEQVEDAADFFIKTMPLYFIGPSVKLITIISGIKGDIIYIFVIAIVSTFVVMAVTGLVSQAIIRHTGRKNDE